MGEEISRTSFDLADHERFMSRVAEETRLVQTLFEDGQFSERGYTLGFEIETGLIDHNYFPAPKNEEFLDVLNHPLAVPELSRFNVELNCTPVLMGGSALSRAQLELQELWNHCNEVAHGLDSNMVMIGILPTLRDKDLTLANLSPLKRYYALNNEIVRQHRGQAIKVDIDGREHLTSEHGDVLLEAAATSFQIHLKTPAHLAHRYYNASLMVSGPILAASANAPFLFGRSLWDETRIPLFEQAIDLRGVHESTQRVTFGSGFLERSITECMAENVEEYPSLLPLLFDEPPEALRHLRLHNGTIWRWNRPLIGFEPDGRPHMRIEHRILPSGPTIADMIANTALYCGLVHALVQTGEDERSNFPFEAARRNFYSAARYGLDAELYWPGGGNLHAGSLLENHLLPLAHVGLRAFGISDGDREFFLNIVAGRLESGQTGAVWQRRAYEKTQNLFETTAMYCERQRSGQPVGDWDI